jgi:biopolymer transport protein ExbD
MKINLHSPIEEVQVQIIPLIDVIFCILTFFLLAALQFTRQQAINVDLPRASTGRAPYMQQRLIVSLDSAGQIFVEQNPVGLDQLSQTLRAYFQANPLGMVVLNASRSSSYNDVIQLLDAMRQVGGDRVALATIAGSPDRPAGSTLAPNAPVNPLNPLGNPTPVAPSTPGRYSFPTAPGQSLNQPGSNSLTAP